MISSKWILGFAGEPRRNGNGEWYDTFIGGQHVFPEELNVCIPPCPLCEAPRILVLQAFAPHHAHSEREIYLFACNSIKCTSNERSWFAARLCKEVKALATDDEDTQSRNTSRGELDSTEQNSREEINWDSDSDSDDSTASDLAADLAGLLLQVQHSKSNSANNHPTGNHTKASCAAKQHDSTQKPSLAQRTVKLQSEREPESSTTCNALHLDSYYVEVEEEPERAKTLVDENTVDRLLNKYEKEEKTRAASGISETWGAETEEQESAASDNFEIFQDQISRAPEQILRYRFNGAPIWPKYPPPNMESKPNCECDSPLVFEVQVLGSCLHYLQPDKSVKPHRKEAGMNFAAIAIYTCQADCTNSKILAHSPCFKLLKQAVVVQQDEW